MRRGSLEVGEFVPRQSLSDASRPDYPFSAEGLWTRLALNRTFTSCAAALGVLALHIAFIAPLWAGEGSQHRESQQYRGEQALQWVVLDASPNSARVREALPGSPRLVAISVSDLLPVLPSETPPPSSPKGSDPQSPDQSSVGALYGRYVGQIRARIDRAWRRPRTAIGAPTFQCRVQIDQDGQGEVADITLVQCNGDERWQLSLVSAIETASPLPAPPDPAVFSRHILLEFRAMAYSPRAPAGLYEPAVSPSAATGQPDSAREAQNAFQALRQAATAPNSHKAIELRIEDTNVEVEPDRQ